MADSKPTISPLRQRLIDNMTTRRLSPKTQWAYAHGVKRFAEFIHCPSDKATAEDRRILQAV
jgi:integrase/recombinase XerD